ncbi:YfdX family protein [Orbus sturtevantii]|uniref:YfdX family protein n=1 Tax=Orbus sturtevantii TaxID=3074109 RepID=UPI00370DBE5D
MKRILTVTALSLAMLSGFVSANTPATSASQAAISAQQIQELSKIATQGFDAMRTMQYARLAVFNANPELATKLTEQAAKLLAADASDWKNFVKHAKDPALTKNDDYILIDSSIAIAENYVATAEKETAIEKANEKMKNGDQKGALEALHLAGVGVNETQYLMPLNQTRQAVSKAQELLKAGKYYEANIVLRDAELAIVVDSETLIDVN